jgi:hypothetical protein
VVGRVGFGGVMLPIDWNMSFSTEQAESGHSPGKYLGRLPKVGTAGRSDQSEE